MIAPFYVVSSNIDAVGYQRGTLYIRFKSGCSYSYDKVPFTIYDVLTKVESAGKAFHQMVKGKFRYTKLEQDPFRA